jgi:signal transduction histidine kinase
MHWLRRWAPEIAWALWAAACLVATVRLENWGTVPFHFLWISLMIVYGRRVWPVGSTAIALVFVMVGCTVALMPEAVRSGEWSEVSEVPLMTAMFVVMVWYARTRERALAEARAAEGRERAFLRDAAHQIRTPIAVARGHAELLRDGAGSAEQEADAEVVIDELDGLARASGRLLVLAATEGPDGLASGDVDVEALLERAARRWSVVAPRRWRLDIAAEGTLRADADRIESALDALIENAVSVTSRDGLIEISARAEGGDAVIAVRDDGAGIAAEDVGQLFEPFHRSMREGQAGRRGTGLGLAIVRAIVEAHGGSVRAEGAPGRGARFEMRLPGLARRADVALGAAPQR